MCSQFSDSAVTLKMIKEIGRKTSKQAKIDNVFQALTPDKNSFFKYL